jgi:hypothetical protein
MAGVDPVPITSDQSLSGVTWNTRDVEPGLYTVAAYIFSPIRANATRDYRAAPQRGLICKLSALAF